MEYSNVFVCLMGMGTVFFGLICLIALTCVMSAVLRTVRKQPAAADPVSVPAVPVAGAAQVSGRVPGHRQKR